MERCHTKKGATAPGKECTNCNAKGHVSGQCTVKQKAGGGGGGKGHGNKGGREKGEKKKRGGNGTATTNPRWIELYPIG